MAPTVDGGQRPVTKGKAPTPPADPRSHEDKAGWQRRFTWNVDQLLKRSLAGGLPITPEQAGLQAKDQTLGEFRTAYPNMMLPEWLP